jgi:serine/threonine-protein kinase
VATETPSVYNGRYELSRHVARGGMAEVYLARDLLLDRPVALKVLFPELSVDRSFVARFRREAQAAANLSHPNIVPIFDWGQSQQSYFIVMEYVDGPPLATVLRDEGALAPDRATAIGTEVAAALAYAHRHGVVHRDVKPGNVLIGHDGTVKVADFGIARAANTEESLTQTGAVMGTATYFSPEQAQGKGVDARSDVYSLGVVLYECVTGYPPFTGENPLSIAYKHVQEEPLPPRELNPDVPAPLEAVILHAMAKDPNERYHDANEFRGDLMAFRQGRAVAAPAPTALAAAGVPTAVQTAVAAPPTRVTDGPRTASYPATPPPPGEEEPPPSHTGRYVALLLVLLAALGVVVYYILSSLGYIGASRITMPGVTGKTLPQAEAVLAGDGLRVGTIHRAAHGGVPGTVFGQSPAAGAAAAKGSAVTLDVTTGRPQVGVPNEVGTSYTQAARALQAAGFTVTKTTRPALEPAGTVVAQSPSGGTQPRGSTVTLTVSSGPATVTVPDVTGDSASVAANALGVHNLTLGTTTSQASASVPKDHVVSTSPPAGTQTYPGATVNLVLSSGPPTQAVPDVTGEQLSQAQATLKGAGFTVTVNNQPTGDPTQNNVVLAEAPPGGSQQPQGATVTLTVGQYQGNQGNNPGGPGHGRGHQTTTTSNPFPFPGG